MELRIAMVTNLSERERERSIGKVGGNNNSTVDDKK